MKAYKRSSLVTGIVLLYHLKLRVRNTQGNTQSKRVKGTACPAGRRCEHETDWGFLDLDSDLPESQAFGRRGSVVLLEASANRPTCTRGCTLSHEAFECNHPPMRKICSGALRQRQERLK